MTAGEKAAFKSVLSVVIPVSNRLAAVLPVLGTESIRTSHDIFVRLAGAITLNAPSVRTSVARPPRAPPVTTRDWAPAIGLDAVIINEPFAKFAKVLQPS